MCKVVGGVVFIQHWATPLSSTELDYVILTVEYGRNENIHIITSDNTLYFVMRREASNDKIQWIIGYIPWPKGMEYITKMNEWMIPNKIFCSENFMRNHSRVYFCLVMMWIFEFLPDSTVCITCIHLTWQIQYFSEGLAVFTLTLPAYSKPDHRGMGLAFTAWVTQPCLSSLQTSSTNLNCLLNAWQ